MPGEGEIDLEHHPTLARPAAWLQREQLGSRARALAAIEHRQPDRAPIDLWVVPEVVGWLQRYNGAGDKEALQRLLGVDSRVLRGPAW